MSQFVTVKPGLWPAIALCLSAVPLCATAQGVAPTVPASSSVPTAPAIPAAPTPGASVPQVEGAEATSATVVTPRRRLPPLVWQLKVDAPEPLDDLLTQHLELARFQRELVDNDTLRISRNELRRLVISAPDEARSMLEAEGYFGAQITTRVDDEVEGKPVVVTLKVVPGERTRISKVQMIYEGALDVALSEGDARAQSLVDRLSADWGLPVGEVFRQSVWSSAKCGRLFSNARQAALRPALSPSKQKTIFSA